MLNQLSLTSGRTRRLGRVAACGILGTLGGLGALGVSTASGQASEVVFAASAHASTSPKSLVPANPAFPGLAGLRFNNWDFPLTRTPTSKQWYATPSILASPVLVAYRDQVVFRGQGLTGGVLAQEGVSEFGVSPLFLGLSVGAQAVRGNDSGQWVATSRSNTSTAISTAISDEDRVFKFDGTAISSVAKANAPAPGLSPTSAWGVTTSGTTPVFTFGFINNTGQASFLARSMTDLTSGISAATANTDGGDAFVRANVTIPTGQLDTTPVSVRDISQFHQNASGTSSIILCTLNTTTDRDSAVVVNGAVVLQEGGPGPGPVATTVSSISEVSMESDGTWFVRGSNADATSWIVRSGTLIARTTEAITPGATETWTTLRDAKGDNNGRYVVNGTTNASSLVNDVLVLNGTRVIARESDAVDLDNNGVVETNLFLHLFQNRGVFGNDLHYYFVARLKSNATDVAGVGNSTVASLLRVSICKADFDRDGVLAVSDIFAFLAAWFAGNPQSNYDGANGIEVADIFAFLAAWFAGC